MKIACKCGRGFYYSSFAIKECKACQNEAGPPTTDTSPLLSFYTGSGASYGQAWARKRLNPDMPTYYREQGVV